MTRLEKWNFWGIRYVSGMKYSIVGEVHGDPQFTDGSVMTTAPVAFYSHDQETNTYYVTTKSGSVYQLGKPLDERSYQTLLSLPREL